MHFHVCPDAVLGLIPTGCDAAGAAQQQAAGEGDGTADAAAHGGDPAAVQRGHRKVPPVPALRYLNFISSRVLEFESATANQPRQPAAPMLSGKSFALAAALEVLGVTGTLLAAVHCGSLVVGVGTKAGDTCHSALHSMQRLDVLLTTASSTVCGCLQQAVTARAGCRLGHHRQVVLQRTGGGAHCIPRCKAFAA